MIALTKDEWETILYYLEKGVEGCAYCDGGPPVPVEQIALDKFRAIMAEE